MWKSGEIDMQDLASLGNVRPAEGESASFATKMLDSEHLVDKGPGDDDEAGGGRADAPPSPDSTDSGAGLDVEPVDTSPDDAYAPDDSSDTDSYSSSDTGSADTDAGSSDSYDPGTSGDIDSGTE